MFKKMLLQQAGLVCWKKLAAEHEHEELKEGVWQAVLRRKTNDVWTDKHRNVTRKLVVEGEPDSRETEELGAESQDFKERFEVAKRNRVTPAE